MKKIIPIPPKNAEKLKTPCEFCIVGCGYIAYKWEVGTDGSLTSNAFNSDLNKVKIPYGNWISENQHQVVKDKNNKEYNLAIIPDPDCFVNKGLESIRGGTLAVKCFNENEKISQDRLLAPYIYESNDHTQTSWSEALELSSRVIKASLDKDGADAIVMKYFDHGMGGGGFENNWAVGKFFFTAIGTQMASIHNRPAYNSEVFAAGDAGTAGLNSNYYELELADTIMLIGSNSMETQTNAWWAHIVPNLKGETLGEKKKEFIKGEPHNSAKLIIVDPRKTTTVSAAETISKNVLHLDLEPGTDIVLFNALSRIIYEKGYHAIDFIQKHTDENSWNSYKKVSLQLERSFEEVLSEAEKITGIERKKLFLACDWIAKPKAGRYRPRVWMGYEKGVIWGIKNYENIASILGLALLTDNCATRYGTACTRMGGHQEGYVRPPYPGKRPGINIDEYLDSNKGNVFMIGGCDPVNTTLDALRMRKLLEKRGNLVKQAIDETAGKPIETRVSAIMEAISKGGLFIIVQNIYFIETAKYAHVVLPAARWGEHFATSMNGERRIRIYEKLYDPPAEAKPDFIIMAMLANKIKTLYEAENNIEMVKRFSGFDWIKEKTAKKQAETCFQDGGNTVFPEAKELGIKGIEAYRGLDYNKLKAFGNNGIILPISTKNNHIIGVYGENTSDERIRGTRILHKDYNFYGGKAKFIPAKWLGFPEKVAKQKNKYRFWINNGRSNQVWQTAYYEMRLEFFEKRLPMAYLELNPKDAKEFSLKTTDIVEVYNDYGSVRAMVYVTEGVKPNHLFMVFGSPKGSVNVLVTNYVDPTTNIPYYKGTWANIKKIGESETLQESITSKDNRNFT